MLGLAQKLRLARQMGGCLQARPAEWRPTALCAWRRRRAKSCCIAAMSA